MKAAERVVRVVSREQARLYMVGHLKLKSNVFSSGSDLPIFPDFGSLTKFLVSC